MAVRSRHQNGQIIPRLPIQPLLKVTTLYETLADGVRAKALMDSIQSRFWAGLQVQSDFWRFDWLREQSLHSTALGAARNSALVILSVSHAKKLPPLVQTWINEWSQQKDHGPCALVLLRPKNRLRPAKLQPLCESLRRAALEKCADFINESFEPGVAYVPADTGPALVPEMHFASASSPTTRWVHQHLQHSQLNLEQARKATKASAPDPSFAPNY